MNTLNEAFTVTRATTSNGKNIAIIDPNRPENKKSFEFKQIFSDNGANWDKYNKYWFWWLSDDPKKTQWIFDFKIKPAIEMVHKAEGATSEDSEASLITSIDSVINNIKSATVAPINDDDGVSATASEKVNILDRLEKFKQKIINLENDVEFKKTMKIIMDFRNSQGHNVSLNNALMIWIQNPKATITKSKKHWRYANREVLPNAQRLIIWAPGKNAMLRPSKEQSLSITQKFLNKNKVYKVVDLPSGERERLNIELRGTLARREFDLVAHYDIADTKLIEGKEDVLNVDNYKNIKWFEEKNIDEKVTPIYNALLQFGKDNNIKIGLSDKLRGDARGVSKNGSIEILQNDGNDVGLTKTLAHEISHEILHQKYLKDYNPKFKDFFVGTDEGRDLVEQQAELSAWMIMSQYGFDLPTSFNYIAMWGANPEGMLKVFDSIAKTVNMLLDYIDDTVKGSIQETEGNDRHHIDSLDVAKVLGVEKQFTQLLAQTQQKQRFNESFYRLVNK
jgi:hypothetical protein